MKKTILNIMYPFIVILAIILIWTITSLIIGVELILPKPNIVFKDFFKYFTESQIYISLGFTLLRSFLAFVISFLIALLLSILSSFNSVLRKINNIIIAITRGVPTMAIILILIIWMSSNFAPVMVCVLVMVPVLYSNLVQSLSLIDNNLLEMAKIYNINKKRIITKIYIPTIKKPVIESFASGFSFSIKLVIASEAMALTNNSIGNMMHNEKIWLETSHLFALTIVAILIGFIVEYLIRFIGRRFIYED